MPPALERTDPAPGVAPDDGRLADVLAAASRGEADAWREIVDLYARRVFALVHSKCRRPDLAEEVTQSVFVTVAGKLSRGGYTERGRFESWLFRVAMNRARDEMRRLARQATPTDPATVAAALDRVSENGVRTRDEASLDALREAMSGLSEPDREVIELRHHGGLSFKQIADLLGEPMGTLLARHHRALRKLRSMIEGVARAEDEEKSR
ncbi:MAG TPA: sigma-70 family RNA polymerase sigma factor [Phycisphaerales bacterium]|nr:sigma-70 family RNA polymerase sigma factor [Phycisphaerales bacterium]